MPIYDYECANCKRRFEVVHGVHVAGPTECPLCGGGPVRKAISAPAVHFKGSGWAKKERRAASPSSSKKDGDGGNSDDAARTTAPTTTVTTERTSDSTGSGGDKTDKTDKADKVEKSTSEKGGD
ncbi:MAG: zinc ribbon domain-containing protein [Chloroflexota bacterium]|nr:zinc ribbon domain-containing protein [Chloroflexota bacterium]